jgi:hypothetical protein
MSVLMQNLESRMQCNSTVVQYPMVAAFQVDQLVTLARPLESKTVEDLASTSYPMQWILIIQNRKSAKTPAKLMDRVRSITCR